MNNDLGVSKFRLKMFLKRLLSANTRKLLVTGAGRDRIGIVKDITGLIFDEDGNIADSRMTKLEQNFALMVLVEIPDRNVESFKERIKRSREYFGIHLDANDVYETPEKTLEIDDYKVFIELVGDDQPGIVYTLTQHLVSQGVNIDNIDTFSYSAPMGGTTLFKVKSKVTVNKIIDFEKFKNSLKSLESSLVVSINVYKEGEASDSSSES
jgi:glycine cleavage system transcriptional repressor